MASKSKKRKVEDEDKVPEEIEEQCLDCHHSLANIEKILKPLLPTSRTVSEEKVSSTLDRTQIHSYFLLLGSLSHSSLILTMHH